MVEDKEKEYGSSSLARHNPAKTSFTKKSAGSWGVLLGSSENLTAIY